MPRYTPNSLTAACALAVLAGIVSATGSSGTERSGLAGLEGTSSEERALEALADPKFSLSTVDAADVEHLIRRGWHNAVQAIVAKSHQGSEAEAQRIATQVRQAVQAERNRLDDLIRALDRNYGKAVDVNPAMQWAQNSTHIFLTVKFAQRWNAPGALEVENETVLITSCCLNFTAFGEHSFIRRRYHLLLEFFEKVLPEASSWSLASVGRMSVTIAKASAANWPRLLHNPSAAPKNLGIWADMRDKWKSELEKLPSIASPSGRSTSSQPGKNEKAAKHKRKKERRRQEPEDSEDDDALDKEVEIISECKPSSYGGTPVAELCASNWKEVVTKPIVKNRRWLIKFYSSQGHGNSEAMRILIPVWKRLADVFPSMVPGGKVGALDCGLEKELCVKLGVPLVKLPQIRRFLHGGDGDIWTGSYDAPIEKLVAFGGNKEEL